MCIFSPHRSAPWFGRRTAVLQAALVLAACAVVAAWLRWPALGAVFGWLVLFSSVLAAVAAAVRRELRIRRRFRALGLGPARRGTRVAR